MIMRRGFTTIEILVSALILGISIMVISEVLRLAIKETIFVPNAENAVFEKMFFDIKAADEVQSETNKLTIFSNEKAIIYEAADSVLYRNGQRIMTGSKIEFSEENGKIVVTPSGIWQQEFVRQRG